MNFVTEFNCFTIDILNLSILEYCFYDQLDSPLGELSLQYLSLSGIDEMTFENLQHVHILLLSNNKLVKLQSELFIQMIGLNKLDLSNNLICDIGANTFRALSNLTYLDLRCNKLEKLDANIFDGLVNLADLRLARVCAYCAHMPQIDPLVFRNLSATLTNLDLGGVFNGSIDSTLLHNLTQLESLNLASNDFTRMDPLLFRDLTSLKSLFLHRNLLASIDSAMFEPISSLIDLRLEDNKLTNIEPLTFAKLTDLDLLDLSFNQIKTLHTQTFATLSSLRRLFLHANPLLDFQPGLFENLAHFSLFNWTSNLTNYDLRNMVVNHTIVL